MLINYRFQNTRSFYNENNLSLEATSDKELNELNTFKVNDNLLIENNQLLKSAVIFGANASGKSNIIKSLSYMWNVIMFSSSQQTNIAQTNQYFEFYENAKNEDSLYEVEFIQDNKYYKYGFIINNGKIKEEWLERRNERITNLFKRNSEEILVNGLGKEVTSLIKVPEYSLFLSIANNYHLSIANDINNVIIWFNKLLFVYENNANSFEIYNMNDNKYKKQALEILKKADIGIKDIKVVKDKLGNMNNIQDILNYNTQLQINPRKYIGQKKFENSDFFNIDILTKFNVYNKENNVIGEKDIMLLKNSDFNSEGTIRLLNYLGWILAALDQGRIIFIDEIDSKLHFLVADYLLKMFNSIDRNPNNAQLICTAHNLLLMDDGLRRDQIYFTSKNEIGVSTLLSLSDFKGVRKNDLFCKKYLAGFYTNLPDMDKDENDGKKI